MERFEKMKSKSLNKFTPEKKITSLKKKQLKSFAFFTNISHYFIRVYS